MKPTCEIAEYASMRLRLVCAIATRLPTTSDSTASGDQHVLPVGVERAEAVTRAGGTPARTTRSSGTEPMNSVTARRRALVDVRHPHVERHRAELERDADHDEHEAEQQQADLGAAAATAVQLVAARACRWRRRSSTCRTAACPRRSRRARNTSSPPRPRCARRDRTRPARTATAPAARGRGTP